MIRGAKPSCKTANQKGPPNGYGQLSWKSPLGGYTDTPEEGVALRGARVTLCYISAEVVRETLNLETGAVRYALEVTKIMRRQTIRARV